MIMEPLSLFLVGVHVNRDWEVLDWLTQGSVAACLSLIISFMLYPESLKSLLESHNGKSGSGLPPVAYSVRLLLIPFVFTVYILMSQRTVGPETKSRRRFQEERRSINKKKQLWKTRV